MPATIEYQPNNIYVIRITGMLKRAEFGQNQAALARQIDSGAKPRLLAILKDFTGWERGADWDDLEFQLSHGNEIAKIAIVGEPDWEPQALAFAGVGFRRAPVRYFPSEQLAEARTWLAE